MQTWPLCFPVAKFEVQCKTFMAARLSSVEEAALGSLKQPFFALLSVSIKDEAVPFLIFSFI